MFLKIPLPINFYFRLESSCWPTTFEVLLALAYSADRIDLPMELFLATSDVD